MYVVIAFAFTPAAIRIDANVCRASWRPIGSRPARCHARWARRQRFDGTNGVSSRRAEDEARVAALARLVLDEDVAERADDRDRPPAGAALRLDLDAALVVVGALDVDHAVREVDVLPAQRHQLAAAQAGVEGGRPDGAVALGQRGEELLRLLGRGDPLASAPDRRQPQVALGFTATSPSSIARRKITRNSATSCR